MIEHVDDAVGHVHDLGLRVVVQIGDGDVPIRSIDALPHLRQLSAAQAVGGWTCDQLGRAIEIDVADRGDGGTEAGARRRAFQRASVAQEPPVGIEHRRPDNDLRRAGAVEIRDRDGTGVDD